MCMVDFLNLHAKGGNARVDWNDHFVEPGDAIMDNHGPYPWEGLKRYAGKTRLVWNTGEEMTLYETSIENNMIIYFYIACHAHHFVYEKQTSDQHIECAFCYEIHIPGDVFPEKWLHLEPNANNRTEFIKDFSFLHYTGAV